MRTIRTFSTSDMDCFCITTDHLDEIQATNQEIAAAKKSGMNVYFTLFDDDEIKYYSGYMNEDIDDEFEPLDWAMGEAGCTEMKIRNKVTGQMETL